MAGGERRRILHVAQAVGEVSETVGGVAVVMLDLARELVARGWDVAIAGPDHGDLPESAAAVGARHISWSATRAPGPGVPGEVRRLRRIVRGFDPDVAHLHSSKAGLDGRLVIRGATPTIFSPHAWSFLHQQPEPLRRAAVRWEQVAARWTDIILCVSDDEEQAGLDRGVRGDYRVMSNTVDLASPELDLADARGKVLPNVSPEEPVVLCIGRLSHQKGQDVLLRAWPEVRRRVPDARLVVVGSGPEAQQLEAMATSDVIFVPAVPRDEVPTWTLAADVVAFPSRWEGQSIGVLETLQLGRPVVVTDCHGMAEALEGGRGLMVKVEDPSSLADAVATYAGDRERAAADGRAAAAAYREVHGRRRRENMAAYVAMIDEIRARPHRR